MTKAQFNSELQSRLTGLPKEDIDRSIEYYNEMIDERIDDGYDEEQAVAELGAMDELISDIIAETSLPKLIRQKAAPARRLKTWEIILLIIGSPIWLSLLIAGAAVILSVYLAMWSVVVSLYAAAVALAAGTVAGAVIAVKLAVRGEWLTGALFFMSMLICAGLAILIFLLANVTARLVFKLGKRITLSIKQSFIRKERE